MIEVLVFLEHSAAAGVTSAVTIAVGPAPRSLAGVPGGGGGHHVELVENFSLGLSSIRESLQKED